MSYDPVHEENGAWYFYDETQADRYGPYPTEEVSRQMMDRYATWLDTGEMPEGFAAEVIL